MNSLSISLTLVALLFAVSIPLAGCHKNADSLSDRRAKLVGNENLQLKKQLNAKDAEILKLQETIAEKDEEILKVRQTAGDSSMKVMQHLVESNKQVDAVTAENAQLKEKIKQLEAKLAEK